jgi:hypothetical protein
MFIDAMGNKSALLQVRRAATNKLVGPRSGVLSIVCAQRDAPGRVAATYVRPEPTYKGNKVTATRPSGIANPPNYREDTATRSSSGSVLEFGAQNVQTPMSSVAEGQCNLSPL